MEVLVSIVVPVYKVEKYVEKCIKSLLNQTYYNIQIIVIDDGSPDKSGIICDKLSKKDARIEVVHKKNEGVSIARNTGIEIAKGEYICFVDSDDYVMPNYIENLVYSMEKDMVDMVVCGHIRNDNNRETKVFSYQEKIMDRSERLFYTYLSVNLEACYPWNKLFKKDIIQKNNIRFPEGIHPGEDLLFCIFYINYVTRVSFIKKYLYVYVNSDISVMSRGRGNSAFNNYYLQIEPIIQFMMREMDKKHEICCKVRLFCICACLTYDNKKYKLHNDMTNVIRIRNENERVFLRAKFIPTRIKLRYQLMIKNVFLFDVLHGLYNKFHNLREGKIETFSR